MFRAVLLPIIRSLFTVHSTLVYVIQVCRQLSSRTIMELPVPSWSCSKVVIKPVWHTPVPNVQWINSWWWAEALPELPVPSWSCSKVVFKPVWHTPVPNVQWINSWWWAEELPEICGVLCQNKFGKLVYLVGFIVKKESLMSLPRQRRKTGHREWSAMLFMIATFFSRLPTSLSA
jgi:hypothetical protein